MDRPSPDDLLKHAAFLRALAFRLVGDDARADDLVQDAYVAALESPPKGSVRAWLGAVVRNLAGKVRRSEDRRDRREHAAARPEPMPPADDVAARIALHKSLVQAVDALEEPYRSTIVLRFFYDLKPQEVAGRLGVPVETVRTRTRRALDLLRGRLDRGALLLALVPLKAAGPSALPWGILMATKRRIVFALALLLLITGGMFAAVRGGNAEAPRASEASHRSASRPAAASAAVAEETAGAPLREEIVVLKGLVLLDGAPVEGARVALFERPPGPPLFDVTTQAYRQLTVPLPQPLDETRTDSAGRFTLRSPRRDCFAVEVLAAGAVATNVLAYVPIVDDLTIRLTRGGELGGRVVDEAGAAVPRALVRWRSYVGRLPYIRGETASDAEGGFRVPAGTDWVLVTAEGYAPATAGEDEFARIVLLRGGRVTGVVRDVAGAAVADAAVLLVTGSVPAETRTDAHGRYEVRLGEGHIVHAMVHAPGRLPLGSWTSELSLPPRPVVAGGELTFDITLPATTELRGTVAEGERAVPDASVTLFRIGALWPVAVAFAKSDAQGAFAFGAVPVGTYDVQAAAGSLFGRADVLVAEEPSSVTVALAPTGRIEGTVGGELGVDQVYLERGVDLGSPRMAQADVDAFRRFVFERIAPAEALRVQARGIFSEPFAVKAGEVARVRVDTSSVRMLCGRVVDPAGKPIAGALVGSFEMGSGHDSVSLSVLREVARTTGADGLFAVPVYGSPSLVVAFHPDMAPARFEGVDPEKELEITLQPGGIVSGRVVWPGGAPARDVRVRAVDLDRTVRIDRWQACPTGEFELRGLSGAMVRIDVEHAEGAQDPTQVEIGTRGIVIELQRTRTIRGAVIDRAGRAVSSAKVTAKAPGKSDVVAHSTTQGRFEIKGLDDGRFDLHLEPGTKSDWHPPKLVPFLPTVVTGIAAGTGDVVVQVDTGREVTGVVLGPDGAPVSRAFIAALGRKGLPPTARSGPDGRFRLAGISPEHDEILVSAKGFPPRAVAMRDAAEIRLEAGECIRLRFLAPDGTPVRDQWIGAAVATPEIAKRVQVWQERLGEAPGAGWLAGASAKTDADGWVEIEGLAPGEYCISSFRIAGGIVPETRARTGGADQTVQLESACSISGTVVDRDGKPLGSVKGEYWINVGAYRGDTPLAWVPTKEDGTFEIEGLTKGPVRLKVSYSGPVPGYEGEMAAEAPARDVRIVATVSSAR